MRQPGGANVLLEGEIVAEGPPRSATVRTQKREVFNKVSTGKLHRGMAFILVTHSMTADLGSCQPDGLGHGQGADTDTIVASARAYVHALNKLLVKRLRTEPVALSA
jgi:hypothetical protein